MAVFDQVAEHYDRFMHIFHLYKVKEIESCLGLKGDEVILDIGGGTGYLATRLASHCKKVYILDESKAMLERVPPHRNVITICGSALKAKDLGIKADVVILSDVFHHIKEQDVLLKNINVTLNKKGRLLLMDFHKKAWRVRLLRLFERVLFGKLYFNTLGETQVLVENNMPLVKTHNFGYYFILEGGYHGK